MSSIKPLDSHSVHKLCSSQVVVSLGIAIKELLENSIDAGAKRIEIKLKNYGCDAVEVIDDGSGIREENFSTLGKKHSTSKISTFEDLVSVTSFGFRGEALNSLCHLADITIHTRAADAVCGTRLVFDNSGTIKSRHPLARSRGTTVCLERLFHTLPVRRRHLTDKMRLMKEFSKAVNLITAYCLAKVGLQISCYRFDAKGYAFGMIRAFQKICHRTVLIFYQEPLTCCNCGLQETKRLHLTTDFYLCLHAFDLSNPGIFWEILPLVSGLRVCPTTM
ncbi:unnamed protein product [Schistocephalus solidus]|uniref:DNA_mis_repair domain-containing protein n=1 Tax=Schistocephalus solidus TaxID=70667 RepID=A0A183TKP1_SCHSO|nr:unnamed protein product [Schistocephalus solidus]